MEGNGYFMPLRYRRRYTPYEFDLKMSQNEDRMNRLGRIIDQDIYYTLLTSRKTPTVSEQNYVVENNKEYNPLNKNLKSNQFPNKNEIIQKDNLMQISNDSFKIPRSPRYMNNNNTNQIKQFDNQNNNIINNNRRYGNNFPNERFMNNENDEPINPYPNKNYNDFNEYNMDNQYPRMMNNQKHLRNRNNRFNDFDYDMDNMNKRYNDYEDPREFNNNIFRSQEISKRNNIPRSPMNYQENEGNINNNRYKNSFKERMNEMDLNDMTIKNKDNYDRINEQGYEKMNNRRRGYYNSQLNFPPKEEEEY